MYFLKKIKNDAYFDGKKHSDTILFDSKKVKDLVFIEYAANIPLGQSNDDPKATTILGHLNRMINVYSGSEIIFFRHDDEEKKGNVINDQAWFIYFGHKIQEKYLTSIENGGYGINIILVDYDFGLDSNYLIVHFKKYDSNSFFKENVLIKK